MMEPVQEVEATTGRRKKGNKQRRSNFGWQGREKRRIKKKLVDQACTPYTGEERRKWLVWGNKSNIYLTVLFLFLIFFFFFFSFCFLFPGYGKKDEEWLNGRRRRRGGWVGLLDVLCTVLLLDNKTRSNRFGTTLKKKKKKKLE